MDFVTRGYQGSKMSVWGRWKKLCQEAQDSWGVWSQVQTGMGWGWGCTDSGNSCKAQASQEYSTGQVGPERILAFPRKKDEALTTYQVLKWKSWDKNARSHGCLGDPSQPLEDLEQLVDLFPGRRSLRVCWHRDENRVDGWQGQAGLPGELLGEGRDLPRSPKASA